MGFMGFTNPFHKESVDDYQGVLVPLANAVRHPTVAAEYARRRSLEGSDGSPHSNDTKKDKTSDNEDGVMRTTSAGYNPYTVEGLRAEVDEDVAASGHDTAYDCKIFVT